jgi:hypothetical protein
LKIIFFSSVFFKTGTKHPLNININNIIKEKSTSRKEKVAAAAALIGVSKDEQKQAEEVIREEKVSKGKIEKNKNHVLHIR